MVKGAFGQKWCFKNDNRSAPSIREVINGLKEFYKNKVKEELK